MPNKKSNKKLLGSTKKQNLPLALGLIALVAIIGAVVAYTSQAATGVFTRSGTQLGSYQGIKSGYRLISSATNIGYVSSIASKSDTQKSSDICAHFKVFKSNPVTTTLTITQQNVSGSLKKSGKTSFGPKTTEGYVCLKQDPYDMDSVIYVTSGTSDGSFGIIGVDKIYGRP